MMQTLTVTSATNGALVFDPSQFLGKFTKDGGRIVAMDISSHATLEGYLVRRGNEIIWVRRDVEIHDTDPTASAPEIRVTPQELGDRLRKVMYDSGVWSKL